MPGAPVRDQVSGARADIAVPFNGDESGVGTVACPKCGADNARTARFCHSCGASINASFEQTDNNGSITSSVRAPASLRVTLVCINEDGTDGNRIDLQYNDSVIGRAGDIRYPTDAFLSPKHARLTIESGKLFIEDLYSLNGTYVKLSEEKRLTPGDTFLMGRQVLRFEKFDAQIVPKARANDGTRYMGSPPPSGHFKLVQVGIGGVTQNVFCLYDSGAVIGREKGDIIFPRDKFMSGRHAQVFPRDDGHYYLTDMGSSNGTWVKIWERRELGGGDFVFLGQQLFRVEVSAR
jgi:pSer/pThr/pTyr-binding forkhead associated (FHA) protein